VVLAGVTVAVVIERGITSGTTTPPRMISQHAGTYADGLALDVTGTFPTHQIVGREVDLHARFESRISWPYDAELYVGGIEQWAISYHNPPSQVLGYSGVGECKGADDAPLLGHEQTSHRVYVQVPSTDCSIDLHLTPIKAGVHSLTLKIYKRYVAARGGIRRIDQYSYTHPYKVPRSSLVRGVRLQWRVSVKGS
jgi:hypothetical protein